ncbi:MAG TPA: CHAT domain-containing protein [Blastocatellia bacterium]|nr:CHAT domain-containing protein [Blastocatellia bacterium]
MSMVTCLGGWLLTLSLSLNNPVLTISNSATQNSSDEAALRTLAEGFFKTWASKDLDGWLRLWSAQAPELEARKKVTTELFANSARILLTSLTVRRIGLVGEKAWVRVELDAQVIDAQTGKEKTGYGKAQRTLACAKEADGWKVARELATFTALAEEVIAAQDDRERSAVLESLDDQTAMAITLNQVGRIYRQRVKYELALSYLKRAHEISQAAGNKPQQGLALQQMGEVRQLMGRYDEAFENYQRSLALAEEMNARAVTADLHGRLASLHILLGRYDSATAEIEQSLSIVKELNDTQSLPGILVRKGNIHSESGRYAEGIEIYQQALDLAEKSRNIIVMDACLNNLGVTYRIQGNYRRALEYLQKSLKLAEGAGDQAGIAQTLNSIGIVFQEQGDHAIALEYFNRALALLGEAKGRTTIDVLQNIGATALRRKNYEQALQFFEKSLAAAEASQDHPARARALGGLGEVYYGAQNYEAAAARFQQVLDLNVRSLNNEAFLALFSLSGIRYQQGDYTQALELADRAGALNKEFESKEITAALSSLRGKIHVAMNDLQQARRDFDESIAALESLRAGVASDERGQSLFFEQRLAAYHGALSLLIQQGQPRAALVYAERSKARVILDVLRNGRADIHGALTEAERRQESRLKEALFGLNRRLAQARQSDARQSQKIMELREQLEKARLNYEVFLTTAYAAHPELKVQRGEAPVIKEEDLGTPIPDAHTALLEYVVTEDKTYLFVITKTAAKPAADVQVYTLPIKRDELSKRTENFRARLAGRDLSFRAAARDLYKLALKPAQAQIRGKTKLVIVPDGMLWELPFQALINERSRYVVETSAVSYAPSISVLREMNLQRAKRPSAASPSALLALGNPAIGQETMARATLTLRDGKLNPLPEAEQEVKELGRLYGAARSKVYVGADAREDRVKTEATQAGVLHFATHGVLNDASPMYSYLALAQGDKNEDGLLEAWELMQLDLRADLVVLSACETARGRFGAGEGMIGLSWALFVAGAPATLVSQWKVESASTRELMLDFHRSLRTPSRNPMSKAEALRQAALNLMKNPATSHPFYWASFVLIGDGG